MPADLPDASERLRKRAAAELTASAAACLEALRTTKVPYLFVAGHEVEPEYQAWLDRVLPQVAFMVWPGSGHFPQLAHPGRFAEALAATARWGSAR